MNNASTRTLTAINALFFAALGLSGPFYTLRLESLGASFARISLILTTFMLVSIAANYTAGWLANRAAWRRPLLAGGLALQAAAYAVIGLAGTLPGAWAGRLLDGLGASAYITVSLAAIGQVLAASGRRGRAMGLFRGIGSVAYAGGALLGGWAAQRWGLSFPFLAAAAISAPAALAAARLDLAAAPAAAQAITPVQAAARRRTTLPVAFLAGTMLYTAGMAAASSMFGNYLHALGRSTTEIGGMASLSAALELPVMAWTGALSDVVGRAPLLAAGGGAMALALALYVLAAVFAPAIVVGQVIRGAGYASYTSNAMAYTADRSTEADRGTNSGAFNVATNVGQLLGLGLGGTLVQLFGFTTFFAVCAAAAGASAACFLLIPQAKRRPVMPERAG
jgi:MFS family permease